MLLLLLPVSIGAEQGSQCCWKGSASVLDAALLWGCDVDTPVVALQTFAWALCLASLFVEA